METNAGKQQSVDNRSNDSPRGIGRSIQLKESYGLPRSPCPVKVDFFEWRLPRAVEIDTVREERLKYQHLEKDIYQQNEELYELQQQQRQEENGSHQSLLTTMKMTGTSSVSRDSVRKQFVSSLQRNPFVDRADLQKFPKRSFERAKVQARQSWIFGLLSLIGTILVSVTVIPSINTNNNHNKKNRSCSQGGPLSELYTPANCHYCILPTTYIQHILPQLRILLLRIQRWRVPIMICATIGFVLAANANIQTIRIAVWKNQQLCQHQCASDIVWNQQTYMRRHPIDLDSNNNNNNNGLDPTQSTRTTGKDNQPVQQSRLMDIDVCIDGCELATGGHCVVISGVLWCCCAMILIWQIIIIIIQEGFSWKSVQLPY